MSAKFTPGPWSYESWSIWGSDSLTHIATVTHQDGDLDTLQANVRLIAAAPELLAALTLALGQLEGCKPMSGVHASSLRADIEIVKGAIAKAIGREVVE